MTAASAEVACPICGVSGRARLATATGERRYCLGCFHGWRSQTVDFPYEGVSMCPLGTSNDRLRSQVDFFRHYLPQQGSILEIGCATGELAAAARGWLSVGRYEAIELSPAGEQALPKVDALYRQPLETLLGAGVVLPRFDLVIASHVLEHIADPAAELRAIKRVLKPAGAIFAEVPNRSGNRGLPFDDNQSHLHFFSISSLSRLLAQEGFESLAIATDAVLDARYADSLRIVARPFDLPVAVADLLSNKMAIAAGEKIVVWGAGSLVEELLANFFDASRIDFFIDRSPAKAGMRRFGRPVLGPDALGAEPRTILVNSIDFADSISADIAERYPGVAHRVVRIGDLLTGSPQENPQQAGAISA